MEFGNQIRRFNSCPGCALVQKTQKDLKDNPDMSDKHVVLTQCTPKLSLFGHSATQIGLVTDKKRIDRLRKLKPDQKLLFQAPTVVITQPGTCKPLIEETAQMMTDKLLKLLHFQ